MLNGEEPRFRLVRFFNWHKFSRFMFLLFVNSQQALIFINQSLLAVVEYGMVSSQFYAGCDITKSPLLTQFSYLLWYHGKLADISLQPKPLLDKYRHKQVVWIYLDKNSPYEVRLMSMSFLWLTFPELIPFSAFFSCINHC